jgi:RNA polymerase sigma-70 factor, ECF subfamily
LSRASIPPIAFSDYFLIFEWNAAPAGRLVKKLAVSAVYSVQTMLDQTLLVRQAQNGDRDAFATLYDRYARLVRAIAYDASGNFSTTHDITQDVFLKAFCRLSQLRNPDRFGAWITQIARRAGRDWQRSNRRDRHEFSPQPPEFTSVIDNDASIELLQAIRSLPYRERVALHVFYLDEQPADVARRTMGLSSSGFYKLLDRARNRLARVLQTNRETAR